MEYLRDGENLQVAWDASNVKRRFQTVQALLLTDICLGCLA